MARRRENRLPARRDEIQKKIKILSERKEHENVHTNYHYVASVANLRFTAASTLAFAKQPQRSCSTVEVLRKKDIEQRR